MATDEEDEDMKYLFPSKSVSQSSKQVSEDPDLYAMLIRIYEQNGNTKRVDQLKKYANLPNEGKKGKRATLRAYLSSDKRARRELAVQARKFLSDRNAGDKTEQKRLAMGKGQSSRSSSIIKAAQGAETQTTALGRTGLNAGAGSRVQGLLGQSGALG